MCWSGGKDSALCLHKVLLAKEYDVKYLLTTLNEQFKRISMHGVREELLDEQAKQIDRKSTRLNSSHIQKSRMPSSA